VSLRTVELKPFVPAKDFELSKDFYRDFFEHFARVHRRAAARAKPRARLASSSPLSLRLAFRHAPPAAAPVEVFAQLLALLGSHALPILPHTSTPSPVARAATDPAYKDSSKRQETDCLPEVQCGPAKNGRY
jgi:hypothetical protein